MKPANEREKLDALIELANAVCDLIYYHTIKSPLKGIPSGELFVRLTMPLESYELLIDQLVSIELVERTPGHLLKWIGPDRDLSEYES